MRQTIWLASILLITPVWGQHVRHTVNGARASLAERQSLRHGIARRAGAAMAEPQATALGQAPGVIQMNLMDASHIVWFVTTETLPAGTVVWPSVTLPDGTEIPLDGLKMNEDVLPGTSFDLPNIRRFSDFWPQGMLTYGVVVTINGRESQVAADLPVGSARNYDDVSQMVPRISSASEGIVSSDVILSIRGTFMNDAPYVLLEDMVVPPGAIRVSPSEIRVNLSRVPGLDLSSAQDLLLTVAQGGWSDTAVFRHTPDRPGTYNPAPR